MQVQQQSDKKFEQEYPRKMRCANQTHGVHYFEAKGPGECYCSSRCRRKNEKREAYPE